MTDIEAGGVAPDWRCDGCGRSATASRLVEGAYLPVHSGTCSQNTALQRCERCGQRHADLTFAQMLACSGQMPTDEAESMAERIFDRALGRRS